MLAEGDFRLLRPITEEHDPDHDDIEPAATEQVTSHFSNAATTPARPLRVLFICAERQPATPIRKLRLAPAATV